MVMVKPALAVPRRRAARCATRSTCPVAAYHVSGEYAMVQGRRRSNGWIDGDAAALERAHVDQAGRRRLRAHLLRARRRRTPRRELAVRSARWRASRAASTHRCGRSRRSAASRSSWRGAEGAYLVDTDGDRYVDYVQSWGASILGHAHPAVVEAVQRAAADGTSFGAPTAREVELAEAIADAGAVGRQGAPRVVGHRGGDDRGAPGPGRHRSRPKILKFAGCYHGHVDALLVAAGSGVATLGLPGSAGRHRGHRGRHRRRALQRRGRARRGVRPLRRRARRGARGADRRQHGPGGARADGFLDGLRAPLHRRRRAAGLRRGDHRLPARARRRAGPLRHHPRPLDVRQGRRRRPPARRASAAGPTSWTSSPRSVPCTRRARCAGTRSPPPPASPSLGAARRRRLRRRSTARATRFADGLRHAFASPTTRPGRRRSARSPASSSPPRRSPTTTRRSRPTTSATRASSTRMLDARRRSSPPSGYETLFVSLAHTDDRSSTARSTPSPSVGATLDVRLRHAPPSGGRRSRTEALRRRPGAGGCGARGP